jgi:cysteine desulfurase
MNFVCNSDTFKKKKFTPSVGDMDSRVWIVCAIIIVMSIVYASRNYNGIMNWSRSTIYLDHNATCPMSDRALLAYESASKFVNPASSYAPGKLANAHLESARTRLAEMLGARRGHIVFTSGGSESNNSVIQSFARTGRILVSGAEHASVMDVEKDVCDTIPVHGDGSVDIPALRRLVRGYVLVCVIYANNEVGTINDIPSIVSVCRSAGVHLHVDAVQAVGKLPVDFDTLGADSYSVSAHKFGGPRGVGLTYHRSVDRTKPFIRGGKQENKLRAGTSNVAGVVSMVAALEEYLALSEDPRLHLRDRVRSMVESGGGIVLGNLSACLPQTVSVAFPGLDSRRIMSELDARNVIINVGSACSMGSRSRVLANMGVDERLERGVMRISWGPRTGEDELMRGIEIILECVRSQKYFSIDE